jgi:hypothetical protein
MKTNTSEQTKSIVSTKETNVQNNNMDEIDATLAALEAEFQEEKQQLKVGTQTQQQDIPIFKRNPKERQKHQVEFEKHQEQLKTGHLLKKLKLLKSKTPTNADPLPTVVRKAPKKVIIPFEDDFSD